MINQALQFFNPHFESLPWFDKYGGLAKVLKKPKTDPQSGKIKGSLIYPVLCSTAAVDCFTAKGYSPLAPDKSKKSVLYFVENGRSLPPEDVGPRARAAKKGGWQRHRIPLKLILWVNMNRLGIDKCNSTDDLLPDILRILKLTGQIPTQLRGSFRRVRLLSGGIDPYEKTRKIFEQYSYKNENRLYLKPYDLFSMNVTLIIEFNAICADFQPGELIPCP